MKQKTKLLYVKELEEYIEITETQFQKLRNEKHIDFDQDGFITMVFCTPIVETSKTERR